MKTRTRLLTLGAAAVVAAGLGTYAYTASAQGGFGTPFMHGMMGSGMGPGMHGGHGMGGPGRGHGMMGHGHGMMGGGHGMMGGHGPVGAAFDPSSHLDALKTALAITPAQETAWTEYRTTLEETATAMHTAMEGTTGEDPHAFFAEMHERQQKSFDAVKAAADKLLASLDETQKTKAEEILPGLASHHGPMGPGPGPGPGMGGGPWMHHGHGG
jgi:hypothetical protein